MHRPLSKLLCAYEIEMGIVCDRRRCTRTATHIVIAHCIDHCKDASPSDYFIPKPCGTGNKVYLMCHPCAKDTAFNMTERMTRMKQAARHAKPGEPIVCKSCESELKNMTRLEYLGAREIRHQGGGRVQLRETD